MAERLSFAPGLCALLLAWLPVFGVSAQADSPEAPLEGTLPEAATPLADEQADAIDRELRRETEREHQLFGVARVRASYPLLASVGLGMLIGERSRAYDCTIQCEVHGWLASAEAGAGGAVWSLGPAYLIGELGNNKYFLSRRYMGYAVRGSVLRTWGRRRFDRTASGTRASRASSPW